MQSMQADKLMSNSIEGVQGDLRRIQEFNAADLIQGKRLGEMAFEGAVAPAQRLIDLFSRIRRDSIDELPPEQINILQEQAKSVFSLFSEILEFKIAAGNV